MQPWEFKSPHGHHYESIMKWLDIEDIVEVLEKKFPDEDIINIRFTDLKKKILSLVEFHDEKNGCNEKILEAIQLAWIEERE